MTRARLPAALLITSSAFICLMIVSCAENPTAVQPKTNQTALTTDSLNR